MKVERVSKHIWSVKSWVFIPIHVWAVVDREGVTLVDAGISPMATGILKLIDRLDAGPLQRILLTHGHPDHVGAVKRILRSESVPVYAHGIEIPFMEGERPYPRRKRAAASIAKGVAQPLSEGGSGDLHKIAGLKPYLTPGHSPGHVVYYHEKDEVLLAGDLFTSRGGKLHRPIPIFTADMAEALRSSSVVKQLTPQRLEVCHGGPVLQPADQLEAYVEATAASLSIPSEAAFAKIEAAAKRHQ